MEPEQQPFDELIEDDGSRAEDRMEPEATPAVDVEGLDPVGFDTDRGIYVYDSDEDSFPDLTEQLMGTDLLDPGSNPGDPEPVYPALQCRSGYIQAGARLCITSVAQNATNYRLAARNCRNLRGQVCSYEELSYLYLSTGLDANFDPNGRWIGNMVGDDDVLCGNKSITFNNDPDIANFEGTCNKSNSRSFWCCHDDE